VVAQSYGMTAVSERHRHRYEVNNAYREQLEKAGLVISGESPDGRLVEVVVLRPDQHPVYAGTQAHPELKSRPTRAHPLFRSFIGAALAYNAAERLPVEIPDDDAPTVIAPVPDGADREIRAVS
jgi:CTP synthase